MGTAPRVRWLGGGMLWVMVKRVWILAVALAIAIAGDGFAASGSGGADETAGERRLLVERIRRSVMETAASTGIHSLDPRVLEAIARVPRHAFLPEAVRAHAYKDMALPFAHGRNTAQPFMIALMIHLADVGPDDVVFETGTGTGYPAALLSVLGQRVYSVEWVPPLVERASDILAGRGYDNVEVRAGDGYYGWPQHGPFDAVIVKGALDHVPAPLIAQLRPGGRIVIPLGPPDDVQILSVVEKDRSGRLSTRRVLPVRFLPLPGATRI